MELTQAIFDEVIAAGEGNKIGNIVYNSLDGYILDPNDYTLGEDINAQRITFKSGESTLKLNNKTLSSHIIIEGSKLTIEEDGVVNGSLGVYSGDFDGNMPSEVIIKGGTYTDLDVTNSRLVIENANIEGEYNAITVGSGADVEINGGTFNIGPEGKVFEVGTHYSEHAKVTVRGGTFSGGQFGLYAKLEAYDQLVLLGGTFKGSEAAINVESIDATSDEELKTSLTDLLGEGYTYSPNMTFITEYTSGKWMSKTNEKELSVVLKPADDNDEELASNSSDGSQELANDDNSNITNNPQT